MEMCCFLLLLGGTDIHLTQMLTFPLCMMLLVACSEQRSEVYETFVPTSSTLDQYQRYCSVCHTDERTGAPLSGDRQAWQERMDKGMNVLIESTANGMGAMPPLGLCFECSRDEFEALINYMYSGDIKNETVEP